MSTIAPEYKTLFNSIYDAVYDEHSGDIDIGLLNKLSTLADGVNSTVYDESNLPYGDIADMVDTLTLRAIANYGHELDGVFPSTDIAEMSAEDCEKRIFELTGERVQVFDMNASASLDLLYAVADVGSIHDLHTLVEEMAETTYFDKVCFIGTPSIGNALPYSEEALQSALRKILNR